MNDGTFKGGGILGKRVSTETRQDILIQAFLTCPNVTEVSKKTGIPRSTIYGISKKRGISGKAGRGKTERREWCGCISAGEFERVRRSPDGYCQG